MWYCVFERQSIWSGKQRVEIRATLVIITLHDSLAEIGSLSREEYISTGDTLRTLLNHVGLLVPID